MQKRVVTLQFSVLVEGDWVTDNCTELQCLLVNIMVGPSKRTCVSDEAFCKLLQDNEYSDDVKCECEL
jgi:hypothetical protein